MDTTTTLDLPEFDLDKCTLQEISDIERLAGTGIAVLAEPTKPRGKLLAAMLYIHRRRHIKGYKWNDAMNVPLDEALTVLGMADDEEPTTDDPDDVTEPGDEIEGDPLDPTESVHTPTD